ncbi:MAG: cytochrome c biogenesis protein ResB [Desulfuromonadales bacterium]|nr:cytochrome c biogenesis protein ResB [Desulfuromonadales bacterium]
MNWSKIEQLLTSLRLTLGLFCSIALYSAVGTFQTRDDGRFELYFQTPLFRFLIVLLAINMLFCTIKTIRRNLQDRNRHFATLAHAATSSWQISVPVDGIAAGLRRQGYLVQEEGDRLLAQRHLAGRWGSTIVHLSCLLIMAGALSSSLGFVGTIHLYNGDKTATYFDWSSQSDRPMGFEFRLDNFEPVYYPIELQFVALDPVSGQELATLTTREGESVQLPGGFSAKVLRYYFFEEDLVLNLYRGGQDLGIYHALGGKRSAESNPPLPMLLKPLAYRDPLVKQLRSEVSILKGGEVVRRGVITINAPLVYDGIAFYQTVYNRDKFGFWSAGFQLGRDPGEPLVWFGCITIVLGLVLAFFRPYQALGIVGQTLIPLAGFSGGSGETALKRLQADFTLETAVSRR